MFIYLFIHHCSFIYLLLLLLPSHIPSRCATQAANLKRPSISFSEIIRQVDIIACNLHLTWLLGLTLYTVRYGFISFHWQKLGLIISVCLFRNGIIGAFRARSDTSNLALLIRLIPMSWENKRSNNQQWLCWKNLLF